MGVRTSLSNSLSELAKRVAPGKPASSPPVGEKKAPGWVIGLTFIGAIVLMVMGVLVLTAGWHTWEHPNRPQVTHPVKATYEVEKKPVKVVKKKGETRRKFRIVKRVKTVERTSQAGGRSETLALAILATGAALLLAGGFAARLTRLKLPGVELEAALSAYGAGVEAGSVVGAHVFKAAQDSDTTDVLEDNAKLAEATTITVATGFDVGSRAAVAAATAAMMGVEPVLTLEAIDDEKLQKAASAAVQTVSEEN